jgi:hypothetical protein
MKATAFPNLSLSKTVSRVTGLFNPEVLFCAGKDERDSLGLCCQGLKEGREKCPVNCEKEEGNCWCTDMWQAWTSHASPMEGQ